jgi:hypothetical protein
VIRRAVAAVTLAVSLSGCASGPTPSEVAARMAVQDDAACREKAGSYQECRTSLANYRQIRIDQKAKADAEHRGLDPVYQERGWSLANLDAADDAECWGVQEQQSQPWLSYFQCRRSHTEARISAMAQMQASQPLVLYCNSFGMMVTCY